MTEYSTLPPSDPRARVPERDDRRRGSSHLYRGRTGSSSLLPFWFSWLWFGPEGLVLASVVLDILDIFPRSRCSLSRLLWNLQLNNSWASLKKMWRLTFDGHSYFEVFWGCLPSVLSVLMLKKQMACIYWNELCCIIKGYSSSHVGRALQSNTFNTYGRGNVKHDLTISISSILIHTLMFFVWQQKSAYEQCVGNQRGSDQVCKARLRGGQSWSWQVIRVVITVNRLLIPHICQFWYTAALFRPVKSTPKSA